MKRIPIRDLKQNASKILHEINRTQEEVIITVNSYEIAKIVPISYKSTTWVKGSIVKKTFII